MTMPAEERLYRQQALDAPVNAMAFVDDLLMVGLGDGRIARWDGQGDALASATIRAHDGAVLCLAVDPAGDAIVTGGDDGRVMRTTKTGDSTEISQFDRWVDHIVASPVSGAVAAGIARRLRIWPLGVSGHHHDHDLPSSIGGMALEAKGKRLAVSHYGGASLFFTSAPGQPRRLAWGGSHLACAFRPQGDYLITASQELTLHGWQLPKAVDMTMPGYPSKTRSFSWSAGARWLATSGGNQAVLWPFQARNGPMGLSPRLVASRSDALVVQVAFQPAKDHLAVGYGDGMVVISRIEDDAIFVIAQSSGVPITQLVWSADGSRLAWGDSNGMLAMCDLRSAR
jgi:WD40 repeat protein